MNITRKAQKTYTFTVTLTEVELRLLNGDLKQQRSSGANPLGPFSALKKMLQDEVDFLNNEAEEHDEDDF